MDIQRALASFEMSMGTAFRWRLSQRELVVQILEYYGEDQNGTVIMEVPTGGGKSIIALAVAHAFNSEGKSGYVMASDLSLFDQYDSDFQRMGLPHGAIRGVDNYSCDLNGLPFSIGECRIRGMSYREAQTLACYQSCRYFRARDRAIRSQTTLTTYPFWLLQQNYVLPKYGEDAPFQRRDFAVFDEAHKIGDIVQSHFSPTFHVRDTERLGRLQEFLDRRKGLGFSFVTQEHANRYMALRNATGKADMQSILQSCEEYFRRIASWGESYRETIKDAFRDSEVPKDVVSAMKVVDWAKDVHCKLEDYNAIHVGRPDSQVRVLEDEGAKFYTTDEAELVRKHLLEKSGFKLLMSATIGDPSRFARIIGAKSCQFIRQDSSFDYSRSPINVMTRFRMSYKEKTASMPRVLEMVDRILDMHPGERGIIHTGNYEISGKIRMGSRHVNRLIWYANSREKAEALSRLEAVPNGVIMGPSLTEGINLDGDLSRFQIVAKVPYPSLADELVKARMEANREWYSWRTGLSLLQAIGRSVRSTDDYATTYVLDACVLDLLGQVNFPKWVLDRIRYVN